MIFDRMTAAKEKSVSEHGKPEQFTLATADYLAFIGTPHPLRTANHAATIWQFDKLSVTEDAAGKSSLHFFSGKSGTTETIDF
ncbi:hypothetical protein [uncultured Sphingomonas sp.]|uniref:hypothetical protein n=1 Tax=uncultured Sphingomonas sp. TaxID=158754 RepID=UPI0035CC272E